MFTLRKPTIRNTNVLRRFADLFTMAKDLLLNKWLILILTALFIALILSPDIHLISPEYKIGSIATKDIRSDRDFLVEDRASTEQKKIEALKTVKSVYDFDSEMPTRIGIAMAQVFLSLSELSSLFIINNQDFDIEGARERLEDSLGIPTSPKEVNILKKYGFSYTICSDIVKIIYSIYRDSNYIIGETISSINKENGIIVRDIKTQQERELINFNTITNIDDERSLVRKKVDDTFISYGADLKNTVVSLVEKIIQPNLTFAKNATEQQKQNVINNTKPVFYKVQKNEIIIRSGEKISASDIDKINSFFKGQEGNRLITISIFLGKFLIVILLAVLLYHISKNRLLSLKINNIDILFACLMAILQLFLVKIGLFICSSITFSTLLIPPLVCIYAIPFTTGTILISIFLNKELGWFFALFSSFLITFLFTDKLAILILSLFGSLIAANHIVYCRQRSSFIKIGISIGVINAAIIFCMTLIAGNILEIETFYKLFMGFLGGILSGIIASALIPVFETLFGYTTDIKLLELANLNHPILQQMVMEAPGTYHHSIVMASMVEAAAEAIGANSLLAKVSAYYHDIGKMKKPLYYIENQYDWNNRHDKLTPKMSSLVIISHVKDGCDLAKKHKLGKAITNIIKQHHGTRIVSYFFSKAKNGTDRSTKTILESDFRYPGPRPQTKEAALVLLGDVIEASSRALTEDPTPSRIRNLVESRVREIVDEGQLDESDLTFKDLSKIIESFSIILTGIFHHRIEYSEPSEINTNGEKEEIKKKDSNGNSYNKSAEKNKIKHFENSTVIQ